MNTIISAKVKGTILNEVVLPDNVKYIHLVGFTDDVTIRLPAKMSRYELTIKEVGFQHPTKSRLLFKRVKLWLRKIFCSHELPEYCGH